MQNWRTPKLKKLAQAIHSLKKENDLLNFLRDLCTLDELEELSNRFEAVKMIEKGIPYRDIAQKCNMSTTTVTRIAWWLEHGESGYREVLKKIK